jgi:hypothetical protein
VQASLSTALLVVATALFALAATRFAKAWFVPVGLACFSASFLFRGVLTAEVQ